MIKPTEHYEELRQGLEEYKYDINYLTLEDCVAHILLDVRVWAGCHGMKPDAIAYAYRLAIQMELAQLDQNILDRVETILRGQPKSIVMNARCICPLCDQGHDPKLTGDSGEGRDKHHHEDGPGGGGYPLQ